MEFGLQAPEMRAASPTMTDSFVDSIEEDTFPHRTFGSTTEEDRKK
jgi:hypothetical protein